MKTKFVNPFTVALLMTLLSLYIYSLDLAFFQLIELKAYDFKVSSRGKRPISNQVLIVAIDEKSLKQEGRWPWPRTVMARLIDRLTEAEVAAIGLDVLFPEKDIYVPFRDVENAINKKDLAGLDRKKLIHWLREVSDSDARLAHALLRSERSVLGYFIYSSASQAEGSSKPWTDKESKLLEFSQYSVVESGGPFPQSVPIRPIYALGISLPELMNAANSAGFVSFLPERDGVVRWVPMVIKGKEGQLFPPFSFQVVKEATKLNTWAGVQPNRVTEIKYGDFNIPVTAEGDLLINFYGPTGTFPRISAADVLSGKVGAEELKGKIVFVGATATGLHDLHTTPYGGLYPGVEIHANVAENIIQNDYLSRPFWVYILDLGMILGMGIFLGIAGNFFKVYGTAFLLFVGIVGYLAVDYYLFSKGIWIHTVYPVFSQIFIYFGLSLYRYTFEEKEKRFIKEAFGQYLAPTIVKQLMDDPSKLKLGGEQKILTAFFCDIEGFAAISEKLFPEEMVELLNIYLTEMTNIIMVHEGTVDKFVGDAIIAFFGAPISFEDHARRSCFAALDMQRKLGELREYWKEQGKPELRMRVGINTGDVVVGNMGSLNRMDYTMMGDSVNLASRLEGVNKQYHTYITISESTYEQSKDDIEARELDLIRVVGKINAVKIYELLGRTGEIEPAIDSILPLYNEGLKHYKNRRWNAGAKSFEKLLGIHENDGPSLTYFDRCIAFSNNPPPADWDGIFGMTGK